MDLNKLCPGCMREIDIRPLKAGEHADAPLHIKGHETAVTNQKRCPYCGYNPNTYKQSARCLPLYTILAGKYLVGAVLGEGGFGITYMGYDLNMETRIAIKEYFPVELVSRDTTSMTGDRVISLSGDKSVTYKQGLKKYVTEAQNVSRFSETPGVVSVKDFFYENETAYIVMEYIEGQSLKDYLKERGGRLSEEEALDIMKPVLEALVKVHEAGIIHRDISPDNIMLTFGDGGDDGETSVKLIDFGAARMTEKNDQKSLTIILKHGYAPEEQYRTHGEQGPWTDVYALCAVFYRMLTGQTPVPAMDRLFRDDLKPMEEWNVNVTKSTQAAILKGLAVKREDRIQSMTKLIQALYEGRKLRTGGAARRSAITAVLGGVAAMVAAAALVIVLTDPRAEREMPDSGETADSIQNDFQQTQGEMTGETAAGQQPVDFSDEASPDSGHGSPGDGTAETLELGQEEEAIGEAIVEPNPQTSFAGSSGHAVLRLDDGTVTSAGSNQYGQRNLSDWNHIATVAAGDTFTAGLREDGKVIVAGELEGKEDVERWEGILAIAGCDSHLYGLSGEGRIVANIVNPLNEACMEWTDIKDISAGPYTISALTLDGRVLTATGFGYEPREISGWEDVRYLACSQHFAYGLCEDGSVKAASIWKGESGAPDLKHEEWKNFHDIVQIYVNHGGIYGVDADGGLHRSGANYAVGNEEILEWSNLAGVTGTVWEDSRMIGLGKDGTILKAAKNQGNADATEMAGLKKVMEPWNRDHRDIAAIGITQDGELLLEAYGDTWMLDGVSNAEDVYVMQWWETEHDTHATCAYLDKSGNLWMEQSVEAGVPGDRQIVDLSLRQIAAVYTRRGDFIAALRQDGTIKFHLAGIWELPDGLREAENWSGVKQIACCSTRSEVGILIGLLEDGTIKAVASSPEAIPKLDGWTDIASIHSGRYAAGGIKKDGTAVFLEDAPEYNQGQYNTFGWTDLTQLAAGLYHTAGLRSDGTVYTVGRNDAGQCDTEEWTDIVYIAVTDCATMGIRSDGTMVIAGEVGW